MSSVAVAKMDGWNCIQMRSAKMCVRDPWQQPPPAVYIMSDVEWLFFPSRFPFLCSAPVHAATGPPSDAVHSVHFVVALRKTTHELDGWIALLLPLQLWLLESRERDVFVSHS